MRSIPKKTADLLLKIKEGGLSANYQSFNEWLTEVRLIIQQGTKEYGTSNVSTPESRCYEDAVVAKRDLCREIENTDIETVLALLETEVII